MILVVSNLSSKITQKSLFDSFNNFGEVDSVQFKRNANDSIAMVKMLNNYDAKTAMRLLNGSALEGRVIKVKPYRKQQN